MKRKSLSPKTRFEVFKRDSFTCQYCGKSAPSVVLRCDHIIAVASGGTNSITNLITACVDCNSGKGARALSDEAVVLKQKAQLDLLQERRAQIEMMAEWQKSLIQSENLEVDALAEIWASVANCGISLNDYGRQVLARLLKTFTFTELAEAMRAGVVGYKVCNKETADHCFLKLGGIAKMRRLEKEKPHIRRAYYIRAILRNKFNNKRLPYTIIKDIVLAVDCGLADIEELVEFAKSCTHLNDFLSRLEP